MTTIYCTSKDTSMSSLPLTRRSNTNTRKLEYLCKCPRCLSESKEGAFVSKATWYRHGNSLREQPTADENPYPSSSLLPPEPIPFTSADTLDGSSTGHLDEVCDILELRHLPTHAPLRSPLTSEITQRPLAPPLKQLMLRLWGQLRTGFK